MLNASQTDKVWIFNTLNLYVHAFWIELIQIAMPLSPMHGTYVDPAYERGHVGWDLYECFWHWIFMVPNAKWVVPHSAETASAVFTLLFHDLQMNWCGPTGSLTAMWSRALTQR